MRKTIFVILLQHFLLWWEKFIFATQMWSIYLNLFEREIWKIWKITEWVQTLSWVPTNQISLLVLRLHRPRRELLLRRPDVVDAGLRPRGVCQDPERRLGDHRWKVRSKFKTFYQQLIFYEARLFAFNLVEPLLHASNHDVALIKAIIKKAKLYTLPVSPTLVSWHTQ